MHRAIQHYLGILPDVSPATEDYVAPARVVLAPPARHYLLRQAHAPGRARGGLLFGRLVDDELRVVLATPGGYADGPQHPLDVSAHYALGAGDVVTLALDADWVGNWVMSASSHLGPVERDLGWLRRAARSGLVDNRNVMVVAGWREGALEARAYLWELGEPLPLPCVLDPRDPSRHSPSAFRDELP